MHQLRPVLFSRRCKKLFGSAIFVFLIDADMTKGERSAEAIDGQSAARILFMADLPASVPHLTLTAIL